MLSTSLLNSLTDCDVIAHLLKKNYNFALYRMPGRETAMLYVSEKVENSFLSEYETSAPCSGFVCAPFSNDCCAFIPAEYSRTMSFGAKPSDDISAAEKKSVPESMPAPDNYVSSVTSIINRLKREGGKTVFSTAHDGQCPLTVYEAFTRLCSQYPDAFVFCFKLKDKQRAWLGATPEVLADVHDDKLYTMALAGTRPVGEVNEEWDNKNKLEQAMVTRFIIYRMEAFGLHPELSDTYTRKAGNIEHICTDIAAALPYRFDLNSFLKELSPTPAVSGLPREDALRDIARYENHRRDFYAGFCGPVTRDKISLFVTLRCMSFDYATKECTLYAGGGITEFSDPQSEWREVNAKVATLCKPLDIVLKYNSK